MNDLATMLGFVREGLAVALLPAYFTDQVPEISLIPIRRHAPTFNTYLATASDRRTTAATNALVQVIDKHVNASETRRRTPVHGRPRG